MAEKDVMKDMEGATEIETDKETNVSSESTPKDSKPTADPNLLDLAFAMDCTGSMGSYINSARQNIRSIVEDLVSKEAADIRLALVEYRDHPPQDRSFVTRVHDFTSSVREMKGWLEGCSAAGGGDGPEAVADALHQVLKLNWRESATKMCVFISDAPPHGLGGSGDGFPNGCPDGLDPMTISGEIAQKCITLYLVGCEPAILPYKEFFSAIAHLTGGQYVPLKHAKLLSQVIIGGAQEEISLQKLMAEVEEDVKKEVAENDAIDEEDLSNRIFSKMNARGVRSKQLQCNNMALPQASEKARYMSKCSNMEEIRSQFKTEEMNTMRSISDGASCRASSAPRYARKKGFLSSMLSKKSAPVMQSCPMPSFEADAPEMSADNVYNVAEDEMIQQEQVSRMVRKQMMKNNVKK